MNTVMNTVRLVPGLALTGLIVTIALAVPAAHPASLDTLIRQLGDPERAERAAGLLAEEGERAVPDLLDVARAAPDMTARGWAVVALGTIPGERVDEILGDLYADTSLPPLVRTWAAAARIGRARTADELFLLAPLTGQLAALDRPLEMRFAALANDGTSMSTEELLRLMTRQPQLQQLLSQVVLDRGARPLVDVMLTGEASLRRQAAAYLATLGQRGANTEVAAAVARALRFEHAAARVPWADGALFLPSIAWPKAPATEMLGHLVAWYLYCDLRGQGNLQQQIHNNLRSLGLANAVGYQGAGQDTEGWLRVWGQVAGRDGLKQLLEDQNLPRSSRYYQILGRL